MLAGVIISVQAWFSYMEISNQKCGMKQAVHIDMHATLGSNLARRS